MGRYYFDVSKRALLRLNGKDGLDLLHRISTNDLLKLAPGEAVGTILINVKGRIIDKILLRRESESGLLLICSSDSASSVSDWISKFIIMEDVSIENCTDQFTHFIIFELDDGESPRQLQDANIEVLGDMMKKSFAGSEFIYGKESNNSPFYHILTSMVNQGKLVDLLEQLFISQADQNTYDYFRIKNRIADYPNELNEEHNPLEANLSHLVSFTKGCYVGQEVIARLDTYEKVQRCLKSMVIDAVPNALPSDLYVEDEKVGTLTSVSKKSGNTLGLGYVRMVGLSATQELFFGDVNGRAHASLIS